MTYGPARFEAFRGQRWGTRTGRLEDYPICPECVPDHDAGRLCGFCLRWFCWRHHAIHGCAYVWLPIWTPSAAVRKRRKVLSTNGLTDRDGRLSVIGGGPG